LLIPYSIAPFGFGHWVNTAGALLGMAAIGWEYYARQPSRMTL
jgi:hypothetical protein